MNNGAALFICRALIGIIFKERRETDENTRFGNTCIEANPAIYASDGTLNYMPIFKVIIAVYLLYVAVLGRARYLKTSI